jgi:hypothetical protein
VVVRVEGLWDDFGSAAVASIVLSGVVQLWDCADVLNRKGWCEDRKLWSCSGG